MRRRLALGAAMVATALAAAGCGSGAGGASTDGRPQVVTSFYPIQFATERIAGGALDVSVLTKPGAEPHDLEITPQDLARMTRSSLVVYSKGFQPAVDEAVEQNAADRSFDVATVQPLMDVTTEHEGAAASAEPDHEQGSAGGKDPHIWLDPTRLATVADQVAERLGKVDPARAADFTTRAKALHADLEKLDSEYTAGLQTCQRREIVTSHAAFGYLAKHYQLTQVGIAGLTPEAEPSPQRLVEVAKEARQHKATTIFFETLVSPKVADTIAREVGARTAVLDPIEGLSTDNGGDYLSVMRTNLQTLRTALSCS